MTVFDGPFSWRMRDLVCLLGGPATRAGRLMRAVMVGRKPDAMYRRIEAMYPEARYLELFARQKREGWQAWGNDTLRFPMQQPLFEAMT